MTPKLKANLIAGAIFAAPVFLLWYCSTKVPTLSDRDLQCRQIVRDVANAKTQAENDYAKQKFGEQCNGWKDPDDRK